MKILLSLILFILSVSAFANDREKLNQLLLEKGTSIAAFEAQGMKLIMGERTGGGRSLKFASVEVVFTKDEAILKDELENPTPANVGSLSSLQSVQAGGRHIKASDIVGVISK